MVGQLKFREVKFKFYIYDKDEVVDDVKIRKFCITIEVKSHSIDGITSEIEEEIVEGLSGLGFEV